MKSVGFFYIFKFRHWFPEEAKCEYYLEATQIEVVTRVWQNPRRGIGMVWECIIRVTNSIFCM
jgi:hypothetical protein